MASGGGEAAPHQLHTCGVECGAWSFFFTAAPTAAGAARLAEETEAGGARAAEPGRPRWKCSSRRGRAPAAQPAGRGPRCGRLHAPRCTASSVVVVRGHRVHPAWCDHAGSRGSRSLRITCAPGRTAHTLLPQRPNSQRPDCSFNAAWLSSERGTPNLPRTVRVSASKSRHERCTLSCAVWPAGAC